ncbi:hypothetical protein [Lishizhenia tianjinensis]|nr:hypothetical protein [Lishizhenia tianjinensis]
MKKLLLATLIFVFSACGLSTQEELILSKAVGDYVDAINQNQVLIKLGLTHPRVVKYYTDQGKDTVQKYFDLENYSINNYVKSKMWTSDNTLCIGYSYTYNEQNHVFYAIQSKTQQNWLFIDERDAFMFPELF